LKIMGGVALVAGGHPGGSDLDQMLRDARKSLEAMRAGTPPKRAEAPLEAVSEAADGRVKATADSRGRLKTLELDPRVMRLDREELSEHVLAAVNGALEDLRSKASVEDAAATVGRVDPELLARQLGEVQDQGLRQMEMISQAIAEATAKLRGGGR
jgi:DNA-binding protein YbaB